MSTTTFRTWQGRTIERSPERRWTMHCDNCDTDINCLDEDDAIDRVVSHNCKEFLPA